MSIFGQNALINQYQPVFKICHVTNGQTLVYDSAQKAFVNANSTGGGGATRLGQLLDVNPSVDNPASLQGGQALVWNPITQLWGNQFIDFNTLLNKPSNSTYSFIGLSDTAKPSLPGGYVVWNSTGTQLVYTTTIPAASITGLATVATTGNYNDLINKPVIGTGSVTNVSVVPSSGIISSVATPTTTPVINLSLGNITPTSILSSGTIFGSNLSGTNTGDQTIVLSGDATGSGTGPITVTLADTTVVPGSYTNSNITVDSKGRITSISSGTIGTGSVTSVNATGIDGVTATGGPITTTGTFTIGLGNITPISVAATGTVTGSNLSGTNTGDQTIVLSGDVSGSGTGAITTSLTPTGVTAGQYSFPIITVDSKGRVTAISNGQVVNTFNGRAGAITLTSADVTSALGFTPGTVTSVAVSTVNGFSGTVANSSQSANISIGTTVSGLVKGDGTAISAATAGVDYSAGTASLATGILKSTTGTGNLSIAVASDFPILNQNTTGTASNVTGIVSIANGGTGQTTATGAINALLPDQTGNAGYVLTTNGTNVNWQALATGSVTLVSTTTSQGVTATVTNPTTTPNISIGLGNITPLSILSTGTIQSSNIAAGATVSGTNTGDQTITLTGPVTGSGTGPVATTITPTGVIAGSYTNSNITVGADGRILSISSGTGGGGGGTGTVYQVDAVGNNGITVTGTPITTTGTITIGLGDITPTSVAATGTVTGLNLSGTNTGDQIVTLTGDATGVSTGTGAATTLNATLNTVNSTPGTFGSGACNVQIPVVTVNAKGLVTNITAAPGDFTPLDTVPANVTITVCAYHQYIVTTRLTVIGRIVNLGRIAVL